MSKRRSLLAGGLSLVVRHWPAVVWTYVFNLALAFVFSIGVYSQLAAVTAHSLAAQRIAAGFDLATFAGVLQKVGEGPSNGQANSLSIPAFVLLYFVLVPGTLFSFVTGASARISTLLGTGLQYFWRFVRVTLLSLLAFAILLGPLIALRKAWTKHEDLHVVGFTALWHNLASLLVIVLVATVIRLYFDLVEVYTVQLGQHMRPATEKAGLRPDRRVRRTLLPAWRALRRHFARAWLTFVLLALLGFAATAGAAVFALHSLAQPRVWPTFLVTQLALAAMLFTRFWQRGAETLLASELPIAAEPVPEEPFVTTDVTAADPVHSESEAVSTVVEPLPVEGTHGTIR